MEADDNRHMNATTGLEGITTLDHWGVIRARGADAAAFLQGQLTNDVAGLGPTQARLAGFCSAKGRLQASFVVWQAAPDELRLACARGVLPATLKRLSMFVLRAKCKLDDASAEIALQGLAGAPAQAAVGTHAPWERRDADDGATLIRLPDAAGLMRALRIARPDAALAGPQAAPGSWQWLEVQSGVPLIEPATVDAFVPQMLNFELIGGVDFKKGCYPGQEIVARSQYRGTIKRRMFLFDVDAAASAGQEVFHATDPGQPAGMVVNAAARPDGRGSSALVEVKLAALADASLHLGAADGPALAPRPLPYPVPSETALPA
jgi:folate-binding protein YgfZ